MELDMLHHSVVTIGSGSPIFGVSTPWHCFRRSSLQLDVIPRQGIVPRLTHVQQLQCPLNPRHVRKANVLSHGHGKKD